ncbi:MAG: hypothetical protein ACYC4Q_12305 [Victivallaceae bacterium]
MKLSRLMVLFSLAILFILCSCNSNTISDPNAISEKERIDMINFARFSLGQTKKILTDSEKSQIMSKEPEVKEFYTSYKTGRMAMSWDFPAKKVTIVALGRLTSDSMKWELAVTKKDGAWTTKNKASAQNAKVDAQPKDFLDLIKKQ